MDYSEVSVKAVELLKKMIAIPSFSRSEAEVSALIKSDMVLNGYEPQEMGLNLILRGRHNRGGRPVLMLNSHMDTVKPVKDWQRDPFAPVVEDGCLYGLGSNDDGAGLVCLLNTFYLLDRKEQPYDLIFVATAEEEVNGVGGMKLVAPQLPEISVALIGEPTGMRPAIVEKGLMVLDFTVQGKSGHAARNEGVNAIYRAMEVIEMIKNLELSEQSELLGPVKKSVTIINAGTQHNVVPGECTFTADIRSNEFYSNHRLFDIISSMLPEWCTVKARSFILNSSRIDPANPIIQRAVRMGLEPFGSPTLSDQAVLSCPSFKLGPGESSRSHTADEFVRIEEIEKAIPLYMALLDGMEII